jgi:hypothetical protein
VAAGALELQRQRSGHGDHLPSWTSPGSNRAANRQAGALARGEIRDSYSVGRGFYPTAWSDRPGVLRSALIEGLEGSVSACHRGRGSERFTPPRGEPRGACPAGAHLKYSTQACAVVSSARTWRSTTPQVAGPARSARALGSAFPQVRGCQESNRNISGSR